MMNYNMLKNGYFEEKISEIFKLNINIERNEEISLKVKI